MFWQGKNPKETERCSKLFYGRKITGTGGKLVLTRLARDDTLPISLLGTLYYYKVTIPQARRRGKLWRCICVCTKAVRKYASLVLTDLLQGLNRDFCDLGCGCSGKHKFPS